MNSENKINLKHQQMPPELLYSFKRSSTKPRCLNDFSPQALGKGYFPYPPWRKNGLVFTRIIILLLFFFVLEPPPVLAHRMLIIQEEEGKLQVVYEGGTPARRATVTLYDSSGSVLKEGPVDKNGAFYYRLSLSPARAEADDGLGHWADYDFTSGAFSREVPLYLKALTGVAFLLALAFIFHKKPFRARRRG